MSSAAHRGAPCIVVGAGLAGAAVAAALARAGHEVLVLDAASEPAGGASALPAGLMAPHLSLDDNLLSRLSRAGIAVTWDEAQAHLRPGIDWGPDGALEHRVRGSLPPHSVAFGPDSTWSRRATPDELAAARLPEGRVAVRHLRAAWIRPAALVLAWLEEPGITFRGNARVAALRPAQGQWHAISDAGDEIARAPLVVLASATGTPALAPTRLVVHPVRGQVSIGTHGHDTVLPPWPVNGNGHFLPRIPHGDGLVWMCGSSYGRGETDLAPRAQDHDANRERLRSLLPAAARALGPAFDAPTVQAWTGIRAASADRRPLVGELATGLWVSTAMGSRGLTFAALCARMLVAQLHGAALPVDAQLAAAFDARR